MLPLIGWAASGVLVVTLAAQVYKDWNGSGESASLWLYVGQLVANTLFIIYAFTQGDVVFIVANALLLLTSITGLIIRHRRKHHREDGQSSTPARLSIHPQHA